MNATFTANKPGANFLVAKNGNIIYEKAFGMANLELNVPMNINNVFEIGSMTKQFTAISIVMLTEQGKINLYDHLNKYIPNFPNGEKISLHHLLTHTSGIKDFTSLKNLNDFAKNDISPKDLIDLFKNEPIDFQPDEKYKYCNSGYIILGYIIELVSGKSYPDFVKENILKKLNMNHSCYANHNKVTANRASGYSKKGNDYENNRYISFSIPYASGSLMSTIGDMNIWQQAIKNNLLINPKTTDKVFTNYSLNNREKIDYGYGWHLENVDGVVIREHGGSIFGFKSMSIYIPSKDIYVVGLTNCDCNSPTELTRQIAELVLKN
ncbi:MAG: serine hydrolase domain-containing protein [Pelobium sp.]